MRWSWKRLRGINSAQNNNAAPSGIDQYREKKIYLGYSGELRSGSLEIQFSSSVRDGILVNIKTVSKWKILFDYCDGNYLINDDKAKYADLLAKLNQLRESKDKLDDREIYNRLQKIVIDHLSTYKA